MRSKWVLAAVAAMAAAMIGAPASAQFSDSYKFLKSVKDGDAKVVLEMLDKSGPTLINTRGDTGETALHLVVRRRETQWLSYLVSKGARPELKDRDGNTPLALAAQLGFVEGVPQLATAATINATNDRGETPLILAVHNRDIAMIRTLLALGANPAQADQIAGKSARDYAAEDKRSAAILKVIDESKVKPAAAPRAVAGPVL